MRVNVDRIPDEGLTLQADEPTDRFPALKDAVQEGAVRFDSPLRMEIQVRRVARFVEASGQLRTSVHLSCSRCLGEFSRSLTIPFEATYSEETPAAEGSRKDAEIELTAEAIDLFPFHGREIDLREAVQEAVLLALPIRPLCREDCGGLCPRCGADLNQGACGCTENVVDPRFAALKGLKLDDR